MNREDERCAQIEDQLRNYLPTGTARYIAGLIVEEGVRFTVTRPRVSKLGDFRPGNRQRPTAISVNGDLNPYAFLITSVHEFAHHFCYKQFGGRVRPHGKEWKRIYTDMLRPFSEQGVFPEDIAEAVKKHLESPSASSCSCPVLNKALTLYDDQSTVFLDSLTVGTHFYFRNQTYAVAEKKRTRYLCKRLNDGRQYLISGRAPVEVIAPTAEP